MADTNNPTTGGRKGGLGGLLAGGLAAGAAAKGLAKQEKTNESLTALSAQSDLQLSVLKDISMFSQLMVVHLKYMSSLMAAQQKIDTAMLAGQLASLQAQEDAIREARLSAEGKDEKTVDVAIPKIQGESAAKEVNKLGIGAWAAAAIPLWILFSEKWLAMQGKVKEGMTVISDRISSFAAMATGWIGKLPVLLGKIPGMKKIAGGLTKIAGMFGKVFTLLTKIPLLGKLLKVIPGIGQIVTVITGVFSGIKAGFEEFKGSGSILRGIIDGVGGAAAGIINSFIGILDIFGINTEGIRDKVWSFFTNIDTFFLETLPNAWNGIVEWFGGAWETTKTTIVDGLGQLFHWVTMPHRFVIEKLQEAFEKVKETIVDVIGGIEDVMQWIRRKINELTDAVTTSDAEREANRLEAQARGRGGTPELRARARAARLRADLEDQGVDISQERYSIDSLMAQAEAGNELLVDKAVNLFSRNRSAEGLQESQAEQDRASNSNNTAVTVVNAPSSTVNNTPISNNVSTGGGGRMSTQDTALAAS